MTALDSKTVFLNFLNICNLALRAHKKVEFPHRQMLDAAERVIGGKNIGVAVTEENSTMPSSYFTLRFQDGVFDVVAQDKQQPDTEWQLDRAYLERTVEHSSQYVDHPEKLEWDWLKSKLGLDT